MCAGSLHTKTFHCRGQTDETYALLSLSPPKKTTKHLDTLRLELLLVCVRLLDGTYRLYLHVMICFIC